MIGSITDRTPNGFGTNAETQAGMMRRLHPALETESECGKSEMLLAFTEGFAPEDLALRIVRKIPIPRTRDPLQLQALAGQALRPRQRVVRWSSALRRLRSG